MFHTSDGHPRKERIYALASRAATVLAVGTCACFGGFGVDDVVDLGEVGHLNPASGFGHWPQAEALILELDR